MPFTHLHTHTEFSLLDGANRIAAYVARAKELGQTACAITDHGVMYGVVDFYKACRKESVKPILGCEVYVAARTRFDKEFAHDNERYHLVLLCENETGYRNLCQLVSRGFTEGFYTKPRVDRELLAQYHEGLIALSACLAGEVPRLLSRGQYDAARDCARWYNSTFGAGHYYIELQDHGLPEQQQLNPSLIRLARELDIPLVATNDAHYLTRDDADLQKVLLAIGTNSRLDEGTGMGFATPEFFVKSEEEMRALFPECPEAIDNTQLVAEKCNVELEFGNTKLPVFHVPGGDSFSYFKEKCESGLRRLKGENPPEEYQERLAFELEVIQTMGYVDYFLIVHDFIDWAEKHGIPVGPGRGSGAGSLAAYCIGITGIDPLEYALLFERFLNPERVSMPDFDIDFCYERRGEVIKYVQEKYGHDHVAQIVTFGTIAAKTAIRDVGRVMGLPYGEVDAAAKAIPAELGITLSRALERSPELRALREAGGALADLIDMALRVEGTPRHTSTHAAGVVITPNPVATYVPLALGGNDPVTQYPMTTLEELGLLKMDFLGLRTLTVINDAVRMIRTELPDFRIEDISRDDAQVFKMLTKGQTSGVFQLESAGMRGALMGLAPQKLEDIIAVISLYRPGPMDSIPKYTENRHHPEKITYPTPLLAPILDVTYGCMVYQEQVMQVFRDLGGFSYGHSDIVRRAMSKKKHSVLQAERAAFVDGCAKKDIEAHVANGIFDSMTSFASYAFNKSHAAAYALVAYQTAWLKCHYPSEFLAAQLSAYLADSGKVAEYIAEAGRLGIAILPPHVNEGGAAFSAGGGKIRFGMLAIKGLGQGFIDEIVAEREAGGSYTSLYNFCRRTHGKHGFNKRAIEALILGGALDGFGQTRNTMVRSLPLIAEALDGGRRDQLSGQIGFGDLLAGGAPSDDWTYVEAPELETSELLRLEKETLGLYISDHPLKAYAQTADSLGCQPIGKLTSDDEDALQRDGERARLLAILTHVRNRFTKKGDAMAIVTAEDMSGAMEVLVFPKVLERLRDVLHEGEILVLDGRVSVREDEPAKLMLGGAALPSETRRIQNSRPQTPPSSPAPPAAPRRLCLRFASADAPEVQAAQKLLAIFSGEDYGKIPVVFFAADTKVPTKHPPAAINAPLLGELERILGAENVVIQ
ncbi:MAG: DNA polymerase III subunit alpha [Oscillospiraceae bacterium]|nr:DNA polymerase III subunit alpha [Oscillospiraceae bacterium]